MRALRSLVSAAEELMLEAELGVKDKCLRSDRPQIPFALFADAFRAG
jgi:hypothetical protein